MKFINLLLLLVSSLLLQAQNSIDVLHYKFKIDLTDDNNKISGLSAITITSSNNLSFVEFDLTNVSNNKGMNVSKVSLVNDESSLINYQHKNDKLLINTNLKAGDTTTFLIAYEGVPADAFIISTTKYGQRSFFADNWPNRGHNWLPCHDDPADKATVEFIVTAPQHYQVVSNGIQIEETNLADNKKRTHWKEDVPISTKVMVIGVADFAVSLSGMIDNCIPVYSWVYPENIDNGFYDYAQAAEILPWFINNIGPYAYKKLANVQSKTTFGGLENANTIFYSENSVNGKRTSESLLAHEIAHQWFGNYATEKSYAHLWLSEGFATYMTILYLENKYGKDTAIAMLKEDREQAINFGNKNPLPVVNHTKDYMALLNANSYQKGGWVLHMLRRQLGDSIFMSGIKKYYSTYGGKTADTKDLQKIFETVSGQELEQFFNQWLFNTVNPNLKVAWKYNEDTKMINITVEQLQEGPAFQLPLDIAINEKNGKRNIQTFKLSKKTETFTLPASKKPIRLIADPNISLLFEGSIIELQ